jgi:cytochrome P450
MAVTQLWREARTPFSGPQLARVHARRMLANPRETLDGLRELPRGIVVLDRGAPGAAIVNDPVLARMVLLDPRAFQKTPATLRYRYAIGDGTATSSLPPDGSAAYAPAISLEEFRRTKRRLVSPAFHQKWAGEYAEAAGRVAASMCTELRAGDTVDAVPFMAGYTMHTLLECLFGSPPTDSMAVSMARLQEALLGSTRFLDRHLRSRARVLGHVFDRGGRDRPPGDWLPGRRRSALRARRQAQQAAVAELLERHRVPDRLPDVVALLQTGSHHGSRQRLTRQQLTHAVTGLLLAGFENSAATGAWALWLLATHPAVQDRVTAEVADRGTHASPLLQACLKETLRSYPPVWSLAREAQRDIRIGDYEFRAGSIVILSPWLLQRRPDVWPMPDRFAPDRFIGAPRPLSGSYFPFGIGARECIGKHFATLELSAIVAALLREWHLQPCPDHAPPAPWLTITQRPDPHVMLRLVARRPGPPPADGRPA